MSIFGKARKKKVIAVLDIASASVGGMLIEQNDENLSSQFSSQNNPDPENGRIKVISTVRKPVNFLFDVDFEASWRCTADALGKVINKLLRDFPSGPGAVLCVFSSLWFVSRVKIIGIRKEKSFEIKKNFFGELLGEEEKKFKEESFLAGALWKNELRFIEHENIKTELNGYFTESPAGKKAKSVSAHFYLSLGIKQAMDKMEKEILKNFGGIPLLFRTFPFVAFFVLNNIIRTKESFLAVEINGETTDIYLIKNNALSEVASFSRGINFLIKNMTTELNTFPGEALSALRVYLRGHRSPESSGKIDALIKQSKEEWLSFFNKTMADIAENAPLPQTVFLLSDKIAGNLFVDCVQNNDLAKFTVLGKPLKVINIKPDWMAHYFDFNSTAPNDNDIVLMFESFFANRAL